MKPPFARTLFDLLDEQASGRPQAIAAIEGDRSVTYAALGLRVRQVATLLRNLGSRRGSRSRHRHQPADVAEPADDFAGGITFGQEIRRHVANRLGV